MSFPPRVPRHCVSWSNRQAWAWPTETIRRIWLARTHCHKRTAKQTEAKFVLEHVSIWCCAYSIGHCVWYGPQEGNGEVCWSPVRLSIYRTQPEDICFVKKNILSFFFPRPDGWNAQFYCLFLLTLAVVDSHKTCFTWPEGRATSEEPVILNAYMLHPQKKGHALEQRGDLC